MQIKSLLASATLLSVASVANAWSPTNGYAPATVECPADTNLIREASGLSPVETEWMAKRNPITKVALRSFLNRATSKFQDKSILNTLFSEDDNVPRIGIAVSGGGYRATFAGAGMIAAMDDRTDGAVDHGLGGLLQSASYMSGLSGGSWFTGTVAWNNWTSVQELINQMGDNDGSIWDIYNSALAPGGSDNTFTAQRFANISSAIKQKSDAGFAVSLADVWGLAFSYYFFPTLPEGGVGYTWSTLQESDVFKNAEMPFVVHLGKAQLAANKGVGIEDTTVEINPYEFGSWDPTVKSFTDIKHLGTKVNNGIPVNQGQCVEGFDNVNFMIATSTNLIEYVEQANSVYYNAMINQLAELFLGNQSQSKDRSLALYSPNPFKGTQSTESGYTTELVDSDSLNMVDGGIDGQVIPFLPLMKKERNLDVVFALDNTADSEFLWPNGDSMVATYQRQFTSIGKYEAFPYVPGMDTFVNAGLNEKPVFFGCDSSNLTDLAYVPPLVVYLPNKLYSFASNISTLQLTFTAKERLALIRNGFESATQGNFTDSPDLLSCIGCAVMRRKQENLGLEFPAECKQCFSEYCWDGSIQLNPNTTTSSNITGTTTSTAVDGSSQTTTILNTIDNVSTLHFETSTTVTCHECEEGKQSSVWTTTTEKCHECESKATGVTGGVGSSNGLLNEIKNGPVNEDDIANVATITITSDCANTSATTSPSSSSNGSANDSSYGSSNGSANGSANGSTNSSVGQSSKVSSKVSSNASPSVMQVAATQIATSSAVSVQLNENSASSLGVKSVVALLTVLGAVIELF